MIDIYLVEISHSILIEEFGGSHGVRDRAGLEASVHRPYATFDLQDLYSSPSEKAVAIFESLIINHPFIDGNKRIAYFMLEFMLTDYGISLAASQDEKYKMSIQASQGLIKYEEILKWVNKHITNP